ncbi:MAG: hypothetical protein OHK0017_02900 [Patescibacteria group bacterium]
MNKVIYLTHPKAMDYDNELYKPIRNSILNNKFNFVFPYEDDGMPYNSKELILNDNCQIVLAEVSEPSTGQGIELGWAIVKNIPIIAFYKPGSKVSNSVKMLVNSIFEYSDPEELVSALEQKLANI